MKLKEFLDYLNSGGGVKGGSEVHQMMHKLSQEAIRLTTKLNSSYHTEEEIISLFSKLTSKAFGC